MSATEKMTLVLLPGWVLGPEPLAPLARAIEHHNEGISVHCAAYSRPRNHRLEAWLEALDAQLPDHAWLGGWSMGGMLATALAERRGQRTPGLITMGASARIMPPAWLNAGRRPKAWRPWLEQGSHDAWHLGKRLLSTLPGADVRQAAAGLALLGSMDLRRTLGRLNIPQLHLFGEHDMLIPAPARQAVAACLPAGGQIQTIANAGHGFVIDQADETAQAITAFMKASSPAL